MSRGTAPLCTILACNNTVASNRVSPFSLRPLEGQQQAEVKSWSNKAVPEITVWTKRSQQGIHTFPQQQPAPLSFPPHKLLI
eukprot:1095188-Pelagomonas_calceolata.AAC.2